MNPVQLRQVSIDTGPVDAAGVADPRPAIHIVALGTAAELFESAANTRVSVTASTLSPLPAEFAPGAGPDAIVACTVGDVRAAAEASIAPVLAFLSEPGHAPELIAAGADDILDEASLRWLPERIQFARERWNARRENTQLQDLLAATATLNTLLATKGVRGIRRALGKIGEAARLDHLYVLRDIPAEGEQSLRFDLPWRWAKKGVSPVRALRRPVRYTQSGLDWREQLKANQVVVASRSTANPAGDEVLSRWGLASCLVLPIHIDGVYWGAVGLNHIAEERAWRPAEIEALRAVAAGLSGALSWFGARDVAQKRESTYRALFEGANDLVYTTDLELRITTANPTSEQVLGFTADEIIGRSILELLSPDSRKRAEEMRDRKIAGLASSTRYELTLVARDGREIPVEVDTHLVYEAGRPVGTQGIARDISARKQSEQTFRELFYNSPQPMFIQDNLSMRFFDANEAACRQYGWSREELIGMSIYAIRPAEDIPRLKELARSMRDDREDLGQWRHMRRNGEIIDVHIHTRRVDFQGRPSRLIIADDITESLRTEAALRRALEVNERIMASVCEVILSTDETGIITFANDRSTLETGYTPGELVGQHFSLLSPPELASDIDDHLTETMATEVEGHFELPIYRKDRSTRWFEWAIAPLLEDGVRIGFVSAGRDITPQREADAEIRRLGAIVNSSVDAIIGSDAAGRIMSWNAAAEQITGYAPEDVLGNPLASLLPLDQNELGRTAELAFREGRTLNGFEVNMSRKDGEHILVTLTAFPLRESTGEVIGFGTIIRDISAERKAQELLREQEEILGLTFRSLKVGVFMAAEDGAIVTVNDEFCALAGRTREQIIGQPYWNLLPSAARERARDLHVLRFSLPIEATGHAREWPVARPDGTLRIISTTTSRFDRENGERCLVVAATDVTENKAAAEQIARLAAIVESSGDAMLTLHLDGRVQTWNGGAELLFGWTGEDAIGVPFEHIINPGNPLAARTAIDLISAGGSLDRVEIDAVRPDGEVIVVSLSLFGVRDVNDRLVSLAAVGRDVTEQKALRSQLQKRVSDLQSLNSLRVRLSTAASETEMVSAGLDALLEVTGSRRGTARLSTDGQRMYLVDSHGFSPAFLGKVGSEAMDVSIHLAGALIVPDIDRLKGWDVHRAALREEGVGAFASVPLRIAGRPSGNLSVHYDHPHTPESDELELAETIAASVSLTLEQHRARLAVDESNERFQAVARATNDAIRDHVLSGDSVWWSDAFMALFGYARDAVLPTISFWESLIHPDDAQEVISGLRTAIIDGARYWSAEYRFRRADGSYANILDRAYILSFDGVATRVIGSMVDVSPLRKAEEEARERERFLSAIIDHSPLALQIYDADGVSIRMNEARRRLLEIPSTSFGIGRFNVLREANNFDTGLGDRFRRAYSGEVVEYLDSHLHTDDSGLWPTDAVFGRWYDQWIFPVKNERGEVTAVVSLVNDVTERHEAQDQLRMAQQYLESVVSNAPLLLYAWDLEGNVTMAAGAAGAELRGDISAGEVGANIFEPGVPSATRDGVLLALQEVESAAEVTFGTRTWDARYSPMRAPGGEITGVIGVLTDITDRQQAERERRLAEERLLSVADSLPIIIFAMDRAGRLSLATGAGLRSLSEPAEKLLSLTAGEDSPSPEMHANVRRALNGESFTAVTPLGGLWLETHFEPVRDVNGDVAGVTGVSLDITERRKTEEALQQTQKLESLGVLAGGIAHDFNNLLVGILGNAGLALAELAPESPARETIEEIEVAGQRAAELARQMLAYSGKGRFVVQRIDLSTLVEEMTHLLRVSITKTAMLEYHFDPRLPSVEVDTTQLRQVVMNLVVNASDAIGDFAGRISVSTGVMHADAAYLAETYLAHDTPEGEYVYLEVADTGNGMDAETRARIFDPFFTTKFTGRGLGLAAVLGIVRGHRGAIKVTSQPGEGTTFRLLLPVAGPPLSAEPAPVADKHVVKSRGLILLADDDATVRAVTTRALESFGFDVLLATDGTEAVARYMERQADINCVLVDLTMPGLRGDEVVDRILETSPAARVILMSGYSEQEALGEFAGAGVAAFIQKPYELDSLRSVILDVVEGARGNSPVAAPGPA